MELNVDGAVELAQTGVSGLAREKQGGQQQEQ
jgi:hypothetical protein